MKQIDPTTEQRPVFDWVVWTFIHLALIGGIGYVAFEVYGNGLAVWVSLSAFIAGMVSLYLFAKVVPGETLMKVILYTVAAANAGYLAYNGAREIGVEAFNSAQVKKFEAGMAQAAKASSRKIASVLGGNAKDASALEKVFDDGVSTTAGSLAFAELAVVLILFAIASKRVAAIRAAVVTVEAKPEKQPISMAPPMQAAPATAKQGTTTISGNTNFTQPGQ
jgi:hypothetical protein